MSGLECKNISKSYKDNKVLDNVSLNIEQGKIYGLIGRNGVGTVSYTHLYALYCTAFLSGIH